MKTITLTTDEALIEAAHEKARAERTTLDEQFRKWLEEYVGREQRVARAMATIHELQQRLSTGGRKFTRDEMNER